MARGWPEGGHPRGRDNLDGDLLGGGPASELRLPSGPTGGHTCGHDELGDGVLVVGLGCRTPAIGQASRKPGRGAGFTARVMSWAASCSVATTCRRSARCWAGCRALATGRASWRPSRSVRPHRRRRARRWARVPSCSCWASQPAAISLRSRPHRRRRARCWARVPSCGYWAGQMPAVRSVVLPDGNMLVGRPRCRDAAMGRASREPGRGAGFTARVMSRASRVHSDEPSGRPDEMPSPACITARLACDGWLAPAAQEVEPVMQAATGS